MAKSVQSLYRLLFDLFTSGELRRIAAGYYPDLAATLPGELASRATLAMEFATALLRGGAIDELLFQTLSDERPRRTEDIERVMREYVSDGSLRGRQATVVEKPRQPPRSEVNRGGAASVPRLPTSLVVIDDSKLPGLAGDGEIAAGVYVVLRTAGEETIEFVAEPAFVRRAALTFHEGEPVFLVPLWPPGVSVDLRADDDVWCLTMFPLGDEVPVNRDLAVAIRAGRVEKAWLLRFLRTEGRPTYYFVLLSVRR